MFDKNITWGIIGVGDVCEVKSGPAYQKTKGFSLKSVMRRDLAKARDFAQRHGIEKYTYNADELINDPEIDAIYIATPPQHHLSFALKVAAADKICCVEKPMARNFEECNKMLLPFESKKLPLFVAYYRRTLPRFLKVKEWIDHEKIGEIRHIHWSLCQPPNPAADYPDFYNWRTDKQIAPGGYFDDLASHGLDLFHFLLGKFKSVCGQSNNQQNLYAAPDAFTGSWVHENGITGSGFWNFGTWKKVDKVEILGEKGRISFAIFNEEPVRLETEKEQLSLAIEHPIHVQQYHVEAMRDQLLYGKAYSSTGKSALHTAWVMDNILGVI
ncbi:Gfo/Idh/MocA family protein [Namhaeicola litoreus]|uniref:Gfo/Idh/MocA family protein n=1 Tax=Namhaeicola litoreus TaxID=1052145 RepID=A0ABW3XYL1_9FLAO